MNKCHFLDSNNFTLRSLSKTPSFLIECNTCSRLYNLIIVGGTELSEMNQRLDVIANNHFTRHVK